MKVLHAGCGKANLPDYLAGHDEVRLDIDPTCKPDVVASLLDIGDIGPFDVLYTAHCLEHLYPYQVPDALAEFRRVTHGTVVVIVPDIEHVAPTDDVLFDSDAGPICGLDLLYGKHDFIEQSPHMAHHCGFTSKTLKHAMQDAGFTDVCVFQIHPYSIGAIGQTYTTDTTDTTDTRN